jgi:hypothetical protein
MRVYALCPRRTDSSIVRSRPPRRCGELLGGQPVEALELLLADLNGPQSRQDVMDWIVGRKLLPATARGALVGRLLGP